MFDANHGDDFLQELHPFREPGQFLAGDFVGRGIAGIDIGAIEGAKPRLAKRLSRGHISMSCGAILSAWERRNFSLWDLGL